MRTNRPDATCQPASKGTQKRDFEPHLATLAIALPAGFDRFVSEAGEPARERSLPPSAAPDIEKLIAVGIKYGIENVGLPVQFMATPTAQPGLKSPAGIEELEADQGAAQVQQPLQEVGAPFVAHAKAAAAKQPGEGPLDHPPVPPEPLRRVDSAPGDPGTDAAGAQRTAKNRIVVGLVSVELGRALAGPAGLPSRAVDGRDGVDQGQ